MEAEISPITFPSMCTVQKVLRWFHSHNASHTGSRPCCGGAYQAGCLPIYLSKLCRPLFFCRPSYTVVLCPRRFRGPIRRFCDNTEPFLFCGWSNNLERASIRSEAPLNWFQVLSFISFDDCLS